MHDDFSMQNAISTNFSHSLISVPCRYTLMHAMHFVWQPPRAGSLSVAPMNGTAIMTKFLLRASDWYVFMCIHDISPLCLTCMHVHRYDEDLPLQYVLSAEDVTIRRTVLLHAGNASSATVLLPYFQHPRVQNRDKHGLKIRGHVYDSLASKVDVCTVKCPLVLVGPQQHTAPHKRAAKLLADVSNGTASAEQVTLLAVSIVEGLNAVESASETTGTVNKSAPPANLAQQTKSRLNVLQAVHRLAESTEQQTVLQAQILDIVASVVAPPPDSVVVESAQVITRDVVAEAIGVTSEFVPTTSADALDMANSFGKALGGIAVSIDRFVDSSHASPDSVQRSTPSKVQHTAVALRNEFKGLAVRFCDRATSTALPGEQAMGSATDTFALSCKKSSTHGRGFIEAVSLQVCSQCWRVLACPHKPMIIEPISPHVTLQR